MRHDSVELINVDVTGIKVYSNVRMKDLSCTKSP